MNAWLEVDLAAIVGNARRLAALVAPARLCAVIKSNAYGHGLLPVARALAGTDIGGLYLGVFGAGEALALRSAEIEQPILVAGPVNETDLGEAARARLDLALLCEDDLDSFLRHGVRTHVKVETGTQRFGMRPEAAVRVLATARERGLQVIGIYSHLANAEELDKGFTFKQLERLERTAADGRDEVDRSTPMLHIAASAAALMWPETRLDMVRCGIALYGAWPSPEVRNFMAGSIPDFKLEPALRWFAPIAQVKDVAAGEPVGYGCAFTPQSDSRIAVLPVGYADGLPRAAGNGRASVRAGKTRAPIVGRICMNACMVDVTTVRPQPNRGDVVEFEIENLADAAGTINYEIVSRLSPTLERRYHEAPRPGPTDGSEQADGEPNVRLDAFYG